MIRGIEVFFVNTTRYKKFVTRLYCTYFVMLIMGIAKKQLFIFLNGKNRIL